jgi:hypothetical protein
MAAIGTLVLASLSFALLVLFDTMVYRQSFFISVKRMFLDDAYFNRSAWTLLVSALLLSCCYDLRERPFGQRLSARLIGWRKDTRWNRN